jgi:oligopeptide/dipeptide ABC transporter ATP-binding protein
MSSLNPTMTVGDQIVESIRAHRATTRAAGLDQAGELLARVGLTEVRRRLAGYPHELSGGQCQRVMIAIALSCRPRLLLADEPTTALDVTVQAQILDLLGELRQALGMAMLYVTHDFGVVSQIADEVAVMYGGRIVEQGPVTQVLDGPAHPYTQALLDCVPHLGMRYTEPLRTIPGRVPDLRRPISGCVFASRCPRVAERCRAEAPPMTTSGAHRFACWSPTGAELVP